MSKKQQQKPPKHLEPGTRKWWRDVLLVYELEQHHIRLLTLAAEAWDRCQGAREALVEHGTTFMDRFQQPRCRPEIQIERDARLAFARLLRELALDILPPPEASKPAFMPGRR